MNNALKRLLSFAMAVVMVMSYGVMPVAAEDNGSETPTSCLGQADVECNFDAHIEGCSKYVASVTSCQGKADVECNFDTHIEGCSKYVAPVTSCQGKADVECNFDTHIEGCPKYEAPVTSCQGKADVECNFDTHIEGCSKYEAPVTCDGSENCPAEEHDEDCLCYDWCVAHGCDQDNGIHLEGCPYTIPCDLTEGCELHKGHWGDCTGIDIFEGEVVAKIGDTPYTTFSDAMTAANAKTGETVTVEIHGEVEFTNGMELNGGYTSISFEGKTENAKITINQSAGGDYLEAHGKTVSFEDLILAKANPAWSGNSGHMGNYFSIQGGTITYTRCTFPNGACANTSTATYNNCTFQNSSEYGLWVYDDALVTVNGGTIDSAKGIKVYSEGETSVTSTLTVQNATFTENVTAKPAVAIGYAAEIKLIGNTYNNSTSVLELDSGSDADCEGITFVAQDASGNDISNTLTAVDRSNGNASCGVLMDGKLYTTVTTAAAAAATESAEEVVIMYSTEETATFVGADIKTSSAAISAPNVVTTVAVAQVGTKKFTDVQEAIKAAVPDSTVELLTDVTVDKWVMITQSLTIGSDQLITVESINGLTIKGNNHTLTVNSIESASNGNRLFYDATNLNIQDLTIKYANNVTGGIGLTSGTISNVTFEGGVGVLPGDGNITITGCTFKTSGSAIYNEEDRDNLTVTGNRFETAEGQYAIYLRGNTTFTGNTVVSGKVNVVNGSPVVTNNNFNDERFKVYNGAAATISGNTINNLVFNDDTDIQATFYNNTLSDAAQAALDAVNPYVAQVVDGENVQMFTDIQEAIKVAAPDGTVTLLNDVTVDEWIMFSEHLTLAGKINTITMNGLTIDGGNHTLTVNSIESGSNGNRLFRDASNLNIKNLTINVEGNSGGISLNSGTIENVTFNGGSNQILPGNGTVTVKGCTFNDSTGHAIYTESTSGTLHIDGCTFNENASGYAVILRTADSTSTNSTYNAKLNLLADGVAANVTGNVFNDRVKLYTSDETLSGNAFGTDGYIAVDSDELTDIDVSRNYWGGGEPSSEQIPSSVTCISYYTTYENNVPGNLVIMEEYIVAYVGSEPFINLMDAINNANGKPVVLTKDITPADDDTTGSIPVIVIPANTTIDANRHTVTAEVYVSGNGEASVKNIGNNKLGFTLTTPASHANVHESEIFIHPGYNNARKYSNPVIYYIDGEPYTAFIEQDRIDVLLPMQADHCEDIVLVTPEQNIDLDKVDYEIFEGAKTIFQYGLLHIYDATSAQYHSETWRKDSKVDLLFKGNGFFSGVTGMKITEKDTGKTYATDPHKISKYVSLDFGCTALTLEHEYLQTMPNGEYMITINYADGGAHTSNLKIIKAASSSKADPTNPKTGDFILMPMAIMTLSAAALAVLLIAKKKHA